MNTAMMWMLRICPKPSCVMCFETPLAPMMCKDTNCPPNMPNRSYKLTCLGDLSPHNPKDLQDLLPKDLTKDLTKDPQDLFPSIPC